MTRASTLVVGLLSLGLMASSGCFTSRFTIRTEVFRGATRTREQRQLVLTRIASQLESLRSLVQYELDLPKITADVITVASEFQALKTSSLTTSIELCVEKQPEDVLGALAVAVESSLRWTSLVATVRSDTREGAQARASVVELLRSRVRERVDGLTDPTLGKGVIDALERARTLEAPNPTDTASVLAEITSLSLGLSGLIETIANEGTAMAATSSSHAASEGVLLKSADLRIMALTNRMQSRAHELIEVVVTLREVDVEVYFARRMAETRRGVLGTVRDVAMGVDAESGREPLAGRIRELASRVRRLSEPSRQTSRTFQDLALLGSRVLDTAFGKTRIELLDPADTRLTSLGNENGAVATPQSMSVLGRENARNWHAVESPFDTFDAEVDGKCEFVAVQETPLNYRIKSLDADPRDAIALEVNFAAQATKLVVDVLGKAAAAYGIPAAGVLAGIMPKGGGGTSTDPSSAIATARAQIEAGQQILRRRLEAERGANQAVSARLNETAKALRTTAKQLDSAAKELGVAPTDRLNIPGLRKRLIDAGNSTEDVRDLESTARGQLGTLKLSLPRSDARRDAALIGEGH